jgi:hypothetical protein
VSERFVGRIMRYATYQLLKEENRPICVLKGTIFVVKTDTGVTIPAMCAVFRTN